MPYYKKYYKPQVMAWIKHFKEDNLHLVVLDMADLTFQDLIFQIYLEIYLDLDLVLDFFLVFFETGTLPRCFVFSILSPDTFSVISMSCYTV